MSNVTKTIELVQEILHQRCQKMPPEEYKQVLEELAADIDGNLDALREENPELFKHVDEQP